MYSKEILKALKAKQIMCEQYEPDYECYEANPMMALANIQSHYQCTQEQALDKLRATNSDATLPIGDKCVFWIRI